MMILRGINENTKMDSKVYVGTKTEIYKMHYNILKDDYRRTGSFKGAKVDDFFPEFDTIYALEVERKSGFPVVEIVEGEYAIRLLSLGILKLYDSRREKYINDCEWRNTPAWI